MRGLVHMAAGKEEASKEEMKQAYRYSPRLVDSYLDTDDADGNENTEEGAQGVPRRVYVDISVSGGSGRLPNEKSDTSNAGAGAGTAAGAGAVGASRLLDLPFEPVSIGQGVGVVHMRPSIPWPSVLPPLMFTDVLTQQQYLGTDTLPFLAQSVVQPRPMAPHEIRPPANANGGGAGGLAAARREKDRRQQRLHQQMGMGGAGEGSVGDFGYQPDLGGGDSALDGDDGGDDDREYAEGRLHDSLLNSITSAASVAGAFSSAELIANSMMGMGAQQQPSLPSHMMGAGGGGGGRQKGRPAMVGSMAAYGGGKYGAPSKAVGMGAEYGQSGQYGYGSEANLNRSLGTEYVDEPLAGGFVGSVMRPNDNGFDGDNYDEGSYMDGDIQAGGYMGHALAEEDEEDARRAVELALGGVHHARGHHDAGAAAGVDEDGYFMEEDGN
jgi:hypothetical protein